MAKVKRKLTEAEIKNAKPKKKAYKLYDEGGLLLLVRPTGTKVWQLPYKLHGKYNLHTIGQYDPLGTAVSTGSAEARILRDQAKALIKQGIDPNYHKKQQILQSSTEKQTTFEAVAREWFAKQVSTWDDRYAASIMRMLENDAFPEIGRVQIANVTRKDMIRVIDRVESRNALDVAKRLNKRCEAIFNYAVVKELCDSNPATGLTHMIKSYKSKGRPYLREEQLPEFLAKLDAYQGGRIVQLALKFLLLTFVRPGELRFAQWKEIDLDKKVWRIPAERMKMTREHIVPLSIQAVSILSELYTLTGDRDIIFTGERGHDKPISDVTLLKALKIMGYVGDKKIVPHGFRSTASTILNEKGFNRDAIERQLAHVPRDRIRAAYNHSEYLDQRKEMMQWYANHIDTMTVKNKS